MPVFDSNTLTATTPPEANDSRVNLALIGRGSISNIATSQFLPAQAPGPSQLSASGDVAYQINGVLNLNINGNFFSYTDGSEYTVVMGASTASYLGKERAWYRTLPDGNITPGSYYTGINDPDDVRYPGYDAGQTSIQAKTVYNGEIQQYQWAGLTQVRLVDDTITYGSKDSPIKNQITQYGNQTVVVQGSNTKTVKGNTSTVTQGDSRTLNVGSTHVAVTAGLSLTSSVGHNKGKIKSRLDDEEKQFDSDDSNALEGITPPSTFQEVQWGQIMPRSHTPPPPMMIDNTQGLSLALNLNAEFLSALMRNALNLVGFGARVFDLDEAQGEHLAAVLKIPLTAMYAGAKKLCMRVGFYLGLPRFIPTPATPGPEIEMDHLPLSAGGEEAQLSTEQAYMAAQREAQAAEEAAQASQTAATRAATESQEANTSATAAKEAEATAQGDLKEAEGVAAKAAEKAKEAEETAKEAEETAKEGEQAAKEGEQAAQKAERVASEAKEAEAAAKKGLESADTHGTSAALDGLNEAKAAASKAADEAQAAKEAAEAAGEKAAKAQEAATAAREAADEATRQLQEANKAADAARGALKTARGESKTASANARKAGSNAQNKQGGADATAAKSTKAQEAAAKADAAAQKRAADAAAKAAAVAKGKTVATGAGALTGAGGGVGVIMGGTGSGHKIKDSQLGSGEIQSESNDSGFDIKH